MHRVLAAAALAANLWPIPRSVAPGQNVVLGPSTRVVAPRELEKPAAFLTRELARLFGTARHISRGSAIRLELSPRGLPHPEEYAIEPQRSAVVVKARDVRAAFWAANTLLDLFQNARRTPAGYQAYVPRIRDWPDQSFRAFMIQGAWSPDEAELKRNLELLARFHINHFALEFGPQVRLDFDASVSRAGSFSKAQARSIIDYGRSLGMEPIGYLNLLGHLDRAYTKDPYTLHGGIDIRTDAAYEHFVFPILNEMLQVYGPIKYFHCGMDEAWDLFSWLSQQGSDPASLLAKHIQRVDAFLHDRNIKLVIWHDMLIAPDLERTLGAPPGPANGGPPQNTAGALALIPRDVILDYWFYDPLPAYPALDYLRKQGFEVWASPWQTPFSLVRYAAARGIPTMGTLWAGPPGCFASPAFNPVTALYAQAVWDASRASPGVNPEPELANAARRATSAILWRRRTLVFPGAKALIAAPGKRRLIPPDAPGIPQRYGVPLDTRHPIDIPPLEAQARPCADVEAARFIVLPSGAELRLDGVNKPRGEDQLILYTKPLLSTGTNIYGVEAAVSADGRVLDVSPYGAGNHPIPAGGFVLSAHSGPNGSNAAALQALAPGERLGVLDAQGNWIGGAPPLRLAVQLPGGRRLRIDGEDRSRGPDELILYTPYGGRSATGTNRYGVEVIVRKGRVAEVHDGAGDALIPQDGYVLSAHSGATSAAAAALRTLHPGDRLQMLLQKGDRELELDRAEARLRRSFPIGTRCSALFLALSTNAAMLPQTPVALWRVRYADGTCETVPARYGTEVLAPGADALPQRTAGPAWMVDTPKEHYLVLEWKNPRPGKTVSSLELTPLPPMLGVGGRILAVTAAVP